MANSNSDVARAARARTAAEARQKKLDAGLIKTVSMQLSTEVATKLRGAKGAGTWEQVISNLIRKANAMEVSKQIKSVEYNDDLYGFVVELNDGRIVQVQYRKESNRLDADYGLHFPHIDRENDYGLNLSESEEELFKDWMDEDKQIQAKAKEFDCA